jgi:hypothetical protein
MKYSLSKDYLWKEIGDQVVVLHFESGRYYSLNPSGSVIWKALLENQSQEEIVAGLCAAFDVDEGIAREDVLTMTGEFLNKKFIEIH